MFETSIVQPDPLNELEKKAKKDSFARRGKEAIIENYAKRNIMTIEEAREKLLAKNESNQTTVKQTDPETTAPEAGTPTDYEATLKQKKPFTVEEEPDPVSPIGMTDEKFNRLEDDTRIVVTAGLIRRFAQMIRAEERLKNKPITLDEMLDIAGEAS